MLIYLGCDVIALQIMGLLLTIIKIPILKAYVYKKYPWLNRKTEPTQHYLQERKAFVVHEFSTIIFNNTDVLLVSSFSGLAIASVYTVYNMIYAALNNLLATANSGLGFVFGQNLEKEKTEIRNIYDAYNSLYTAALFMLFTVAALLTKPFITLYTAGVTDTNYLLPGLTILFVVMNLLSGVRAVASRLITVSGHADKTKVRSLIEAGINLGASLILVSFFGIYGVLMGTVVALLYRSNDIIIYANTKILERSPLHDYLGIFANTVVAILIYWSVQIWNPAMNNYLLLFLYAALFVVVCAVVYGAIAIALNAKVFRPYLCMFKQKLTAKRRG